MQSVSTVPEKTHLHLRDVFFWTVAFKDGTILQEYDESRPDGRGWIETSEKTVTAVAIALPSGNVIHHVAVPEGAQAVFFRRRSIQVSPTGDEQKKLPTHHCIGWKRDDEAVYLFISEDGTTLLTNDLQAV